MKAKQGRLAEAEVDARAVLLSRLKEQGKYNPATAKFVMGLAGMLIEEGRYDDAEKLIAPRSTSSARSASAMTASTARKSCRSSAPC